MKCFLCVAVVACVAGLAVSRPEPRQSGREDDAAPANMNGLYLIANPNRASPVPYNTDYTKRENVSYFDVYTPPIVTRYGEVFWTMMDAVPLDADVVAKFKGKTMAIVGYEADQVRKTENGDVSMPIFWQYNHHYIAHLTGAQSTVKEVDEESFRASEDSENGVHNQERFWLPVEVVTDDKVGAAPADIPTYQVFSEGNGGEYRKSYHGYPRGYAQLIHSPDMFHISPMQIDTHNRDHDGTAFVAGPLPKSAAVQRENPETSGLLECPCSDRIARSIVTAYSTLQAGACATPVTNATECFAAAATLKVRSSAGRIVSDAGLPSGCSVVASVRDNSSVVVYFNTVAQGTACGGGTLFSATGSAISNVTMALALNTSSAGLATISLSGPDGVWFGVGFNAAAMKQLPYAIIVNGTGGVMERKLANHGPGTLLAESVTVVSDAVVNGVRTVVLTRPLQGASKDHFTFFDPSKQPTLPFISAVGNTSAFAYHRFKGIATLSLTAENGVSCICKSGINGSINGMPFNKTCRDEPYGDLIQQKNPTCWVQSYQGGVHCCHHQWILLDQDQNPWENITDSYHLKFRFWYEEYDSAGATPSHQDLPRVYYQTAAYSGEYDVPEKQDTTPAGSAVHQITAHFQVRDMIQPRDNATGVALIYAGGHCHAPSCLSIELYDGDTGRLLCQQLPVYGTGNTAADKFDERGYLLLPPCLWGAEDEGLEPPVFMAFDGKMTSIKRNNNTYAHYGETASWQMRGVYV